MASQKQLTDALRLFTENGYLDRLEADALVELILADGKVSAEEREFLERVVTTCILDEGALLRLRGIIDGSRHRR